MARLRSLAEIVLFVRDLDASLAFYRDLLGLTAISPPGFPAAFLRVGDEGAGVPQQIVLVPRPQGVAANTGPKPTHDLHHIGLEIGAGDYEAEKQRLADAGLPIRGGKHPFLPVEAIYIDDPDGNEVEIVARVG